MTFPSITNRGEFFSNHYLDTMIDADLSGLRARWDEAEAKGGDTARKRLRGLGREFFAARADAAEASRERRAVAVRALNNLVLTALGFPPPQQTERLTLVRGEVDKLEAPVATAHETSTGLLLVALHAGFAADVDDLFDTDGSDAAGRLPEPLWRPGDKKAVHNAADAVNELFAVDDPPRFVLVCGGPVLLLADRTRWSEGRFLAVDLDAALERNDTKKAGELETIAALFSADALVADDGQSVLDELTDRSHRHAVGVSKELRHGLRRSIEILANEVIRQRLAAGRAVYEGANRVEPKRLTQECLRWLYRLLVLLYAESRPELGVLPTDDDTYVGGYSLDRLRELVLVELDTDRARNGSHLHESLQKLFDLVNDGYHRDHAEQALRFDPVAEGEASYEEYLAFPGLDATLFDQKATPLLDGVRLRNEPLQQVLQLLMLSPESKGRGKRKEQRGFISYAQLGINQLGAVYEGLMSYSGLFAREDVYEVAKDGDPAGGTWLVPVGEADRLPDDVFVTEVDPLTGRRERVRHRRGEFVFRLSGRDRQRSASYYTPEVLTRCTVHHALAELLGLDRYAPEGGSAQIEQATDLLALTICEPALGSGAFVNEAINQLAAEYLRRRQAELGEQLSPERYRLELAKVKTLFALHQSYGVDLNATAVELAEVSIWLNCMHPGLKAPWFMFQLRRGNSLIGARRTVLPGRALADKAWADRVPDDRPLHAGAIEAGEVHHFLLPAHGWLAAADAKEAKELRADRCKGLREARKALLAKLTAEEVRRAERLALRVEALWSAATDRLRLLQRGLRRPIDVYGARQPAPNVPISPSAAQDVVQDADSPLGRLRAAMDAWVGLWFWDVHGEVSPPTRAQWFTVLEQLLGAGGGEPLGQLPLFDTVEELHEAENLRLGLDTQATVAELCERHPWFNRALGLAQREAAWHWELEFAPIFADRGGFDLQVGNPPWVRLDWEDDVALAELDPWFGVTDLKAETPQVRARRTAALEGRASQADYLTEVARAAGLRSAVGSVLLHPVLKGVRTNLYQLFMELVWRNASPTGSSSLIHPESHFADPAAGVFRASTYARLRRHWQFLNGLFLFEEINDKTVFGVHIYGRPQSIGFAQMSYLLDPATVDASLDHDGSGELPAVQHPVGGWDLRPHADRVVAVDEEVLGRWAQLFDEPGTPAPEARLLRPVTNADLSALDVLAAQPTRLADHEYFFTQGLNETNAKRDGTIRWETAVAGSWDEVVLQGPHFTVATPFAKQPREVVRHNQDYDDWDHENLPERVIPRTNYQRAYDPDTYRSRLDHWNGRPFTDHWRVAWRAMTQPGLERSLHAALIPPGAAHVHTVHSLAGSTTRHTAVLAGLWAALPYDYLVKVSGKSHVQDELVRRFPFPAESVYYRPLLLRTLRLNCMTADYATLWEELYDPAWTDDAWTDPNMTRLALGDVGPKWTLDTPLRREQDRRAALVELDALAALILGLSADQLCAMYRSQFAVLRKYENQMVFDAEGRKICAFHQSTGYLQSRLQRLAMTGALPKEFGSIWSMRVAALDGIDDFNQGGFYPPLCEPTREAELRLAMSTVTKRTPNQGARAKVFSIYGEASVDVG